MKLGLIAVLIAAIVTGCDDASVSPNDPPVVERLAKPDLGATIIEASGQLETGVKPKLLYQQCVKQAPITESLHQKWFCQFGFMTNESRQDCSVVLSLQAFDHESVWLADVEL